VDKSYPHRPGPRPANEGVSQKPHAKVGQRTPLYKVLKGADLDGRKSVVSSSLRADSVPLPLVIRESQPSARISFGFEQEEPVKAKELDVRTDLFSFGSVLYEMGTGKMPFDESSAGDICGLIVQQDPVPLSRV